MAKTNQKALTAEHVALTEMRVRKGNRSRALTTAERNYLVQMGKEGERPNIARKWVSRASIDFSLIMVSVFDGPGEMLGDWPAEMIASGENRDMAPEG